jgi:hypothetical protein
MYLFCSHSSYLGIIQIHWCSAPTITPVASDFVCQPTSMAIMMKLHKLISQKKVLYYYRAIDG